jgi:dTDP-4-dehydrorhamnose 3,5-epimerase
MNRVSIEQIDGVEVRKILNSNDARGSIMKFTSILDEQKLMDTVLISSNLTKGTVRGMHLQLHPFEEEKLITCIQGAVFDIIIDLRPASLTFAKWASIELNPNNCNQLFLPPGIAHGFQTLLPNSTMHYCIQGVYTPNSAISIRPHNELNLEWPLSFSNISKQDENGLSFYEAASKFEASYNHK